MYSSGCQLYSLGDEAFSPVTGPQCDEGEADSVEVAGFLFGANPTSCVPPGDALTPTATSTLTTDSASAAVTTTQAAVADTVVTAAAGCSPGAAGLSQALAVCATNAAAIVVPTAAIVSGRTRAVFGGETQIQQQPGQLVTSCSHHPRGLAAPAAGAVAAPTSCLQQIHHVQNESPGLGPMSTATEQQQQQHQQQSHFMQQQPQRHQQVQPITTPSIVSCNKDPVKLLAGSRTKKYSGPLPYRPRRTKVDKSDHHCKICDKYYSNRKQLRKHVNSFHAEEPFEMTSKNLNLDRVNWCLEAGCDFRHDRNPVFTKHLEEKHSIVVERIDRKFTTFAEYEAWKTETEELRKIKFVAGDGYYWRLTKEGRRVSRQHLFCHKAKEFNTVGKKVAFRMEGHTEEEIERLVKPTWNKITESLAKETQARKESLAQRNSSPAGNVGDDNSTEGEDTLDLAVDEMEVIRRLVPDKQNLIKTARTNSKGGCFLFSQCTAYLHVTIYEHDRSVHVDGCLSHYGHDPVLEHDIFDLPESVVAKLKQKFVKGHSLDEARCFAANSWPHLRLKAGALEGIRDRNLRRILFKQYYAQFTNIFERVVDISRTINQFYFIEPNDVLVTLLDIEHTLHDLHKQLVKKVNETLYPSYKPDKVLRDSPVDIQQVLETLSMQQNFSHFKRLVKYSEHHKAFYMNHKITKSNLQCVSEFDMALADEAYRCFELEDDNKRSVDEQIRRKRRDAPAGEDDSSTSLEKAPLQGGMVPQDIVPDQSIGEQVVHPLPTGIPVPLCSMGASSIAELHSDVTTPMAQFDDPANHCHTDPGIAPQSHHQHHHHQAHHHHHHHQQQQQAQQHQSCDIHFMDTSVSPSFSSPTESHTPTAAEHESKKSSLNEFLRHAAEVARHGGEPKEVLTPPGQNGQPVNIANTQCPMGHGHPVSFHAEDESVTLSHLPEFLPKSPIGVEENAKNDISSAGLAIPGGPERAESAAPAPGHVATVDLSTYLTLGAPFGAPDSDSEAGNEGDLMLNFDHLFGPRTPQS